MSAPKNGSERHSAAKASRAANTATGGLTAGGALGILAWMAVAAVRNSWPHVTPWPVEVDYGMAAILALGVSRQWTAWRIYRYDRKGRPNQMTSPKFF